MVAVVLLLVSCPRWNPLGMTANEVIRGMEGMYAHLKSYSDTGAYTAGDTLITFKTLYKAPGKMYFEFTSGGATYYFCAGGERGVPPPFPDFPQSNGSPKKTWLADAYINGGVEKDSLELEIAGFSGISRGTAYNVPTMLFPLSAGCHCHDLKNAQIVRKEKVGGEVCYVIHGEDQTLWIGARTFTLYKLEEASDSGVETTVYRPTLNVPIADSRFVFKRPISLGEEAVTGG